MAILEVNWYLREYNRSNIKRGSILQLPPVEFLAKLKYLSLLSAPFHSYMMALSLSLSPLSSLPHPALASIPKTCIHADKRQRQLRPTATNGDSSTCVQYFN